MSVTLTDRGSHAFRHPGGAYSAVPEVDEWAGDHGVDIRAMRRVAALAAGREECPTCHATDAPSCGSCGGTGECRECRGTGECEECQGDGVVAGCDTCHGRGYVEVASS